MFLPGLPSILWDQILRSKDQEGFMQMKYPAIMQLMSLVASTGSNTNLYRILLVILVVILTLLGLVFLGLLALIVLKSGSEPDIQGQPSPEQESVPVMASVTQDANGQEEEANEQEN